MYLLVVLDSYSRFVLVYGLRRKSDALAGVKVAITDLSKYHRANIECFRVDMGTEWTNAEFRAFCADAVIRLEFTAPDTPQQNAPVESAIWRLMKGGTVCRRSAAEQFGIPDFSVIPGLDPRGDGLWLESVRYIAGCLNRCSTKANPGNISPYEAFTGIKPDAIVLPFFQPGMMRVIRKTKLDDQSAKCYFLGHGYQHGRSTVRVLKASTGQVCHTRDIVWISRSAASLPTPLAAAPPQPPTVQPRFRPRAYRHPFWFAGPAASAGEGGVVGIPATQQPLPPSSSPPTPAPLLPPPQPRLSGTGLPLATPPLTSPPPAPPQPLALLPGAAGPSASGPPPEETPLPRPASAMPPLSRRAITELRPGRTGGMADARITSRTRSGGTRGGGDATRHNHGLLSLSGRDVLLSALATQDLVNTLRAEPGGGMPGQGEQHGGGSVPVALVTHFARREDIDIAIMEQRPHHDLPELPLLCHGSYLRVTKTFTEATSQRYQYRHLFEDAMCRGFHGLISAGTFTIAN